MDSEEFSASLQKAYQEALREADKIKEQALAILREAEAERDAAVAMRRTAEQEAEAMAATNYRDRQRECREAAQTELPGNPRLAYKEAGRSGTITFINDQTKFEMWWEFAGDDALVILSIPDVQSWEIRTGLPLQDREAILNFIGRQVVKQKITSAGAYHIGDSIMTFYGPF